MRPPKIALICTLIGSCIMVSSMLLGEELHGPIFNGFLSKPHLWLVAGLETTVWVFPSTFLVAVLLGKRKYTKDVTQILYSLGLWAGIAVLILIVYYLLGSTPKAPQAYFFSRHYLYGWYIPGFISILIFSYLCPLLLARSKEYENSDPTTL